MSELNNLIVKLSKNEQGYYKKRLKAHAVSKDHSYKVLFDEIKSGNKINAKEKYQLYWQLINVMYDYHSANTAEREINACITMAQVQLLKSDAATARKLTTAALETALQKELTALALHIISFTKQRLLDMYSIAEVPEKLNEINAIEVNLFELQKTESDLLSRYNMLYCLVRKKNIARSIQEIDEYLAITNHFIFTDDDARLTKQSVILKHTILATIYYMIGNTPLALNYSNKLLAVFSADKNIDNRYAKFFIEALNNHYIISTDLNTIQNAAETLQQIEKISSSKTMKGKTQLISRLNELKLMYAIELLKTYKRNDDFILQLNKIDSDFTTMREHMPQNKLNMFYFMLAENYLKIKEYKKSHSYIRQIINAKTPSVGMLTASYFLDMIILFETKEFIFLEQRIRNTYRFLKKNERLMYFEEQVLKLLAQILSGKIKHEKDFFALFKIIIEKSMADANEQKVLKYFDYTAWVNTHV